MRIWTLHPKYLDTKGLVALWREALLCRAVLRGETKGYTKHPQLERFRALSDPVKAINLYLTEVCAEGLRRGFRFAQEKLPADLPNRIHVKMPAEAAQERKTIESRTDNQTRILPDDVTIIPPITSQIPVTAGQVEFEWRHLLVKLHTRDRPRWQQWRHTSVNARECHPIFVVDHSASNIETWEKGEPIDTLPGEKQDGKHTNSTKPSVQAVPLEDESNPTVSRTRIRSRSDSTLAKIEGTEGSVNTKRRR